MSALDTAPSRTAGTAPDSRSAHLVRSVTAVLASPRTTAVIVALYGAQALLLSVLARRSIYDEDYHLAVIGHFSRGGSPFAQQPAALLGVGDVTRYGSYLYHWVMGGVQWVVTNLVGLSPTGAWYVIRVLTALIATAGVYYVWKVFRELDLPPGVANVALFVVVMVPMQVYVGSIVNYDAAAFALCAAATYVGLRLYNATRFRADLWGPFVVLVVFAGLTKFAVLAFLAILCVAVLVRQVVVARGTFVTGVLELVQARGGRRWLNVAGVLLTAGALALFVERFVVNLARYGSPSPACDVVQPLDVCMTWGPFGRDETLDAGFADLPADATNVGNYLSRHFVTLMAYNLSWFGVVTPTGVLQSHGPEILGWIIVAAAFVGAFVLVAGLIGFGAGRGDLVLVLGSGLYMVALVNEMMGAYLVGGVPAGVQGRYLVIFLPFLVGLVARYLHRFASASPHPVRLYVVAVAAILLVATQGGGALAFFDQSDPDWWTTTSGIRYSLGSAVSWVAHHLIVPDLWIVDPRVPR